MNLTKHIAVLFLAISIVLAKKDRVRLTDVETLTLYSDKWTTSRRSSPVKQLSCIGGYCNRAPQSAQCYNRGFDGNDVQWECKADLPMNFKFGRLEVSCEGYEYPDDDYILIGSCGLEYTIDEISKTSNYYSNIKSYATDSDNGSTIIIIVFVALVALYFYFRSSSNRRTEQRYGDNDTNRSSSFTSSAPPPPGFRPDYFKTNSESYSGSTSSETSGGTSSGPGFYSGMATGGLLGYLFGNRGNGGYGRRRGYHDSSYWNTPQTSGYSSYDNSSSRTSTSTGFASTKRR